MQDEINEKTIALYIKTGKLTAQTLQKAMKTLLAQMKKQKDKTPQGKQTLKQLMKQNAGVSNIEITEGNIKALLTWLTRSKPIRSVARQSRKRSPLSGRSFWQIRKRHRRNPQSRSHRTWKGAERLEKLKKFEDVDVIASLEAIMKQNTAFYQSDFDIDKRILLEAAARPVAEDKRLLWFSRPSGTCCVRERDVFLKDTRQHNTWRFYGEQTRDKILAYAVELTGTERGKLKGNLYELDYPQHFRDVAEKSILADNYTLIYEHGERSQPAGQYFDGNPDPQLGKFERFEAQPNDLEALKALLREQQHSRKQHRPGDFKEHIAALHDCRIETEAHRVVEEMKKFDKPNSPDKSHFSAELSPYFLRLATDKDMDRLFSMLPYKSLSFSAMEGKHGVYALISKDENRDRSIKKPRPSLRAQLEADKAKTTPKKAAAKSKNHEMEV